MITVNWRSGGEYLMNVTPEELRALGISDTEIEQAVIAEKKRRAIKRRNTELMGSSWAQDAHVPLPEAVKEQWKAYRQALFEINEGTISDPDKIEWPEAPTQGKEYAFTL